MVKLSHTNALEHLKNYLNAKAGHLDKIQRGLEQLKKVLELKDIPKRIECYDISNTQGTNSVGSMVVFEKGLPKKSEYRKFKILGKTTPDDFEMMKEVLTRRLQRSIASEPETPNNKSKTSPKIWPIPDLIVIDGGKGQLNAAITALTVQNSPLCNTKVIGLAKRIEEIFQPGKKNSIILSHDQPALQLLQRIRDEAHRFGITFHRQLRSKQAFTSSLDNIKGIGPKTKKLLKQKFGTVANIKKASPEELAKVVGKNLATSLKEAL